MGDNVSVCWRVQKCPSACVPPALRRDINGAFDDQSTNERTAPRDEASDRVSGSGSSKEH